MPTRSLLAPFQILRLSYGPVVDHQKTSSTFFTEPVMPRGEESLLLTGTHSGQSNKNR